jgi:hypothetical protein
LISINEIDGAREIRALHLPDDAKHLRNHLAGALDPHRIAAAHVQTRDIDPAAALRGLAKSRLSEAS